MQYQEFITYDSQSVFFKAWKVKNAKAVIQIFHGLGETAEYYDELADDMNRKGISVYLHEYREHGYTKAICNTQENILTQDQKDAFAFYKLIRQENPDIPIILLAHSLGTLIAGNAVYRQPDFWKGVILTGIPYGKDYEEQLLCSVYREIEENGLHAPNIDAAQQLFGSLNDGFPEESLLAWITGDEQKRSYYEKLPSTNVSYSNQFYRDFLLYKGILRDANADRTGRKDLPFLILNGKEDVISDYGKSAEELAGKLKAEGFSDVVLHIYPGVRHSILQDISRKQVYEDIYTWMKRFDNPNWRRQL